MARRFRSCSNRLDSAPKPVESVQSISSWQTNAESKLVWLGSARIGSTSQETARSHSNLTAWRPISSNGRGSLNRCTGLARIAGWGLLFGLSRAMAAMLWLAPLLSPRHAETALQTLPRAPWIGFEPLSHLPQRGQGGGLLGIPEGSF